MNKNSSLCFVNLTWMCESLLGSFGRAFHVCNFFPCVFVGKEFKLNEGVAGYRVFWRQVQLPHKNDVAS